MAYTTAVKNAAVDAMTAMGHWISVHTGDPGTTGTNRVTALNPLQTTWGSASAGAAAGTQLAFADAPAVHYTHYGVWADEAMTTFRWGFALDPGVTYDAPGTLYVTPRVTFP